MIDLNTCINASNWKKDTYQHYVFYSPKLQVLTFLKQQIAQDATFSCFKIRFKYFYQPFACLIINTVTNEFFLARDHFGLEPFYYTIIHNEPKQLCFGSTLPDVLAYVINPVLNKQQVEGVLTDICAGSLTYTDKTFYENVFRVTPGQIVQLKLTSMFKAHHHPYWTLTPGTPFIYYASDDDYDAHFAFLLQEACSVCCQQAPDSVALEFSGGLDTSAILTALDISGVPAQLFMHVGDVVEERQYGEQLLQELKSPYPVHYINADNFDVIAVLNQCKQWFAGGAPYLFFMFAANIHQAVAKNDCKILLSGFGGDECASSHAPLRTYGAEVGFKSLWQELSMTHRNHSRMRRLLQTFKLTQPQLYYGWQRIQSYQSALARKQALIHHKPYHSLQEREADWLTGQLSHHVRMRIEYSAVVAKNMGFTYHYPLLYPPLVEYCFALPPAQKRRSGQNRLLIRRYLAKHIPSKLFDTHKKCGNILPSTMPKCQDLYKNGRLNHAFQDLSYNDIYDYIIKNQLVTKDRLFHLDVLRYMFQ